MLFQTSNDRTIMNSHKPA